MFFGEGYDSATAQAEWNPYSGGGTSGWIWTNHEYVSGRFATPTSGPTSQFLTLARALKTQGQLTNDVEAATWPQGDIDKLTKTARKNVGGAWFKVLQDSSTGLWTVDRNKTNLRYDGTSATLATITGYALPTPDSDDTGRALPAQVVTGTANNCAGTMTPWGTVISGEENVQDFYGDLEANWDGNQKFITGMGFDAGAAISPKYEPAAPGAAAYATAAWSQTSVPTERHRLDTLGWLAEFEPGLPPDHYFGRPQAPKGDAGLPDGGLPPTDRGHKKLGAIGRARWEGATFVVGPDRRLLPNQPVVVYAGDDRRGGRIFKFVSKNAYTPGMTRA